MAGDKQQRFELPIFRLLPLAIGALVLLAVVPVAVLGYLGAWRNTAELGSLNREYLIQLIVDRLTDQFEPVTIQAGYIQDSVAAGLVDVTEQNTFDAFAFGALAATPQDIGIALVRPDGSLRLYVRPEKAAFDEAPTPSTRENLADSSAAGERRIVSSRVRWSDLIGQPIVEFRAPLWRDRRLHGILIAAVRVSDLSGFLRSLKLPDSIVPFIIDEKGGVLAHPYLAEGFVWTAPSADTPTLPQIGSIGDPVLAAFWTAERHELRVSRPLHDADAHWSWVADESHGYFYRTIVDRGGARWLIGFHEPGLASRSERWTVYGIAIAGIATLILGLLTAVWLGRQLRRPVLALEHAADRAQALDFAALQRLPRSAIAEINAATRAFERMASGLRWFEAYLPRAVVRRLIAAGVEQPASERRELTVMFIDIQGYTAYAHGRPAEQVGGALNRLFACLGPQIEATGGTIDKYTGDGLMAFWGAPDERPQHAADACRAALSFGAAFDGFLADPPSPGIESWRLRVGIQTGEVIVGNLGFAGRINYTIIGDAANEAQRLEALGKREIGDGRLVVLVGEAAWAQAGSGFAFSEIADPPAALAAIGRIYRLEIADAERLR